MDFSINISKIQMMMMMIHDDIYDIYIYYISHILSTS